MNTADYIGIPFSDRGRTIQGLDCWGLVRLWYDRELGIILPAFTGYRSATESQRIAQIVDGEKPRWQKVEDPGTGDVVVLQIGGHACHVGLYIENNKMLHITKGIDSCLEHLDASTWRNRIEGVYRYE